MPDIASGKFLYGRTKNLGDFNSKKVEIELAFAVENNDHTTALNNVSRIAISACEAILEGKAVPAFLQAANAAAPAAPAAGGDKAALAAKALAGEQEVAAPKTRAKKPPKEEPVKVAEEVTDDAGLDDLLDAPAAEITDADIQAKIVKRAQDTKNAPAIRLLVGKYVTPPKRATDIPQELRPKFVAELEAVPKIEA